MYKPSGILLILFIYSQTAAALDIDIRSSHSNTLDAALWISNSDFSLDRQNSEIDISVDRFGLSLFDIVPNGVQYGAILGHAGLSDTAQPETEGLSFSGQYLAVELRYPVVQYDRFEMLLGGQYLYQQVDASTVQRTGRQTWRELQGFARARLRLGRSLALWLSIKQGELKVKQQVSGDIASSIEMENGQRDAAGIGLDFYAGDNGWVGLHGSWGYEAGIYIKFQRLFPNQL